MTRQAPIPQREKKRSGTSGPSLRAVTSVEGCPSQTAMHLGEPTASAAVVDRLGWRCGAGIGGEWGWNGMAVWYSVSLMVGWRLLVGA